MFKQFWQRQCPCCKKPINLSDRLCLLQRELVTCKYCAKPLQPNFKTMLFNAFWLSMSASWIIKLSTQLNYEWALIVALFCLASILPALDLLFGLEEHKFN